MSPTATEAQVFSSQAVCLAWIHLIFLLAHFPCLAGEAGLTAPPGATFPIMFYSVTKKIAGVALALTTLLCAFSFAFFVMQFGNTARKINSVVRCFLKTLIMVLGEFELQDLRKSLAESSSEPTQVFTMLLLVGLIIFGSVIMVSWIKFTSICY